ncbi:MAG TPA: methyltransferase [Isosphaeraceae bacterium]|nr:methyltransferase [Isosphaeraceae bacterium]
MNQRLRLFARSLHDRVMLRLRCSHRFSRWLLRVRVPDSVTAGLWDYTTLLFKKALRRHASPGLLVWDLGCGSIAVLAQIAARCAPKGIVASDLDPDCVASARNAVAEFEWPIEVIESDLGERITGAFDLVLFNAPYLPLSRPDRLSSLPGFHEPERYTRRFGGGADGLDTIRRLFRDPVTRSRLAPGGKLLLGFNRFYLPQELVERDAADTGLCVVDRVSAVGNPSLVIVLREVP